jgi:hypothetical protein
MAKNKNPGKETPKKWSSLPDSRNTKEAGQYPNYRIEKTRSGHTMIFDDSKGAESITIQHRGGSAIQFNANGAVQITSHNGMYNVVFGEKRMVVTGAHDVTVKGEGSFRVYGDYNKTIHGNVNYAVEGDFNVTAKNLNRNIRGNIDTQALNETKKLEGSSAVQAQGAIAQVAQKSVALVSQGDSAHLGGKDVNVAAASGTLNLKSKEDLHIHSESGDIHQLADSGDVNTDGTKVYIASQKAKESQIKDAGATSKPSEQTSGSYKLA